MYVFIYSYPPNAPGASNAYTGERGNMSVRPRILMFSERAG